MIVLDTNVISEPLRPQPDMKVLTWLDAQISTDLYLTSTSLTELQFGIAIMHQGQKRAQLEERLVGLLDRLFENRLLVADRASALIHARIAARTRERGITLHFADAQIASIAQARGFAVATRDVEAFEAAGVEVINPWA